MAEPQLVTGRILVTLDGGEDNIGRIIQHTCIGEPRLMIPRAAVPPGDPVPDFGFYDHIVFAKEMAGEVEISGVVYLGMSADAVLAVIPD